MASRVFAQVFFSVIIKLYCSPFVPDWWVVIFNVCTGYKLLKIIPEVMLHVGLLDLQCKVILSFLVGCWKVTCIGCTTERALSTCLT